jgi:branched-chain amino acid transport system substrate-binding protein
VPAAKAGINVQQVPLPPMAADAGAAVTAAGKGADAIFGLTASSGCVAIMQSAQQPNVKAKLFFAEGCADPNALKPAGSAAYGSYFNSDFLAPTDTTDPDVTTYRNVMKQYQHSAPLSLSSQIGFSEVMTTIAAL